MNYLDKAINYLSPKWGFIRSKYRSYEAAAFSRRTKSFDKASSTGPNIEVGMALTTLRNRSRLFVRNNGWAKRAIEVITNSTIGEGIRPAPTGTVNQVKKAKKLWKDWAESKSCDWYEKNTLYGLQALAMKSIAEGGDILVIRRRVRPTSDNPIPIQIQLLEGDQLDHSKDYLSYDNEEYSRLGVQYTKDGKIKGYWVYDQHPSDGLSFFNKLDSQLISKDDCLHVFELLRIGQIRGVPMGISAFIKLSDFSDYEDAQLMRQKVAACFSAFVQTPEEGEGGTDIYEHIEPGMIQYLKAGEEITFGMPPPAEGYDSYTKKILQGIAAAYNITYEQLTMDYSNVNFTSGRMAKIDATPYFKGLQYNMMVPQFCVPVWNWFMDAAIMAGAMATRVLCSCTDWTAPRIQQLDPNKETTARILALQGGLMTISECIREDGRDPEEFFEEYKKDMDRLKELGINVSSIVLPVIEEKDDDDPDNNTPSQPISKSSKPQPKDNKDSKKTVTKSDQAIDEPIDSEVLAVKIGVGGTTSMVEILTSEILTEPQKIGILEVLFGLTEQDAKKMLKK